MSQAQNIPANPFGKLLLEEMERDMETARTNLLVKVDRAKFPEHLFKRYFLQYFLGQVESTPENMIVANWVGIAGTPTSEVDIIDPAGNVLFTIPPIFPTDAINSAQSQHRYMPFLRLFNEVQNQEVSLATLASDTLYHGLVAKSRDLISSNVQSDYHQRLWGGMLAYYKIPTPQQSNLQRTPQTESLEDDIIGYT